MKTNYEGTSMLDMVFENRNKAYGAYVLRQDHDKSLRTAMLFSFGSVLILLMGHFIAEKIKTTTPPATLVEEIIQIADVQLENRLAAIKPKIEPPHVQAAPVSTVRNTEMRVVANERASSDSIPATQDLVNAESGISNTAGTGTSSLGAEGGRGNVASPDPPAEAAAPTIYNWVEKMPEFPGGQNKLMKFLLDHTEYPIREKDLGISGKVSAAFVINEDGRVSDIKVLKSPSPGFDREAIRVIRLLPPFSPGIQQNKAVKVRMIVPFNFTLNEY